MNLFIQLEVAMERLKFTAWFGGFVLFFMAVILGALDMAQGKEAFAAPLSGVAIVVVAYWMLTFAMLSILLNGILSITWGVAWLWNKRKEVKEMNR